jgi:hypothetical protein
METLLTQGSKNLRSLVFDDVARSLGKRDPGALRALAERLPPGWEKQYVIRFTTENLARSDPSAAFDMARTLTNDQFRRATLSDLAQSIDPSRLSEFRELAAKLPGREDREAAEDGIVSVWAQFDPIAAATWALRDERPSTQREYLHRIMFRWDDHSAAVRWAQAIQDEDTRSLAIEVVAHHMAETEPDLAAALLEQLPERNRDYLPAHITEQWAKNDPDGAAAWAITLPEGESRGRALQKVIDAKMGSGIADVAAWLETLPAGGSRDTAVDYFSNLTRSIDPVGTLAWTLTIADDWKRRGAIARTVEAWRETDPEAARRWIESTDTLPPETKKKLLE